jgi:hypothetical protein
MTGSYKILMDKLDEFIRKYYKNLLLKGGIYSVSLLVLFFIAIAALEHYGRFQSYGRAIIFYSFLIASISVIVKYIAIPLSKLYKLGDLISHEEAAKIIGNHFSTIQDKLLNVLQLNKQADAESGISKELIEAGINQKIGELKPIPFASAIDFKDNRKYIKYAIAPVGLLLIILFASPSIITESTSRIIDYGSHYEKPAPFRFIIQNEELKGLQNEDFTLQVKVAGELIPDNAFLEINNTRHKLSKEGKIHFSHSFKNLQKSFKFRLIADEVITEDLEFVVLPNPMVLDFSVELSFPQYLNRKNENLKNVGDLNIPEGTTAQWTFSTGNTKALSINFSDTSQYLKPSAPNRFTTSFKFRKSGAYSVKAANEHVVGKDSVSFFANVIADQYPSIEVEERADSVSTKRLYFRGNIRDDYGFKRLNFNYKKLSSDTAKTRSEELPFSRSTNTDKFYHFWDLSLIQIEPGDEIEYYFEVWDNDGVNGSKSARTQKSVFKAPTLKEIAANSEKANTEIKKDLESGLKEAKDLQKEINELNKKLLEKKTLGWDDKKRVEDLMQKHRNLQNKVEDIQKQNKENMIKQSEYKEPDERILEKQEKLQELFEQIMTEEMKEMLKQLEKLLENLDKNTLKDAMDQMKMDAKDLEKELDRSLELFKQLEFEQKAREATEKLKQLSEKQKDLSKKTEEKGADQKELLNKQEELKKEFDDLKKDLENLEKKNKELESPNPMQDTKEQQKEVEQKMDNSSKDIKDNKNKNASQNQKDAAQKMEEMAEKLEKMMDEAEDEQQEEDLNALRDILENLVRLSFDQEEVMQKLKKTDRNDPLYLSLTQTQKKLKDDSKMIEDSLFALSKRVPQLNAVINREISGINQNMDKAISHLAERQTPQANSRQQYAMTSINNLALMLSEITKQMQQQMSQKKAGNKSCSKPGSEGKPKPSAGNMKKMQEQVNKQIQKLKEQMEKEGGQPKGKSGGGQSGMSQELAKAAAQQAALRQQLQKLSQELQKDGKGGTKTLDNLANLMEETEKDLVNKRITNETLKRQQEIMTRLLEAENAEREREMDEKRESKEAKNENYGNPALFFEYKRQKQKEAELLKTVPPALNPFYKNKVTEYFNNIEE